MMAPLNENAGNAYPEAQIPGMTLMNDGQATASAVSLRTHSSKFPIERELILSADKASSKIPLMHESRAQRSVGLSLLTRQTGAIAPDHPPKQMHAWQQQQQSTPLSQQQIQSSSDTGAINRTPARFPEDVTALADRDNVGRDLARDSNKNAVTKTYHTLKDLISSKFKKDSLGDPGDELNNVIVHQQHQLQSLVGRQSIEELHPPTDITSRIHQMHQHLNQSQPNILASSSNIQKMNGTNGDGGGGDIRKTPQQRAASQPQLNSTGCSRHAANDVVTDSDDGGFASRSVTNRRPQTLYYLTNPNQQPPPFVGNQRQQHTKHTHLQDMMHKKRFHETHMMSQPPPQPPMHQSKELRKVIEQDKPNAGRPGPDATKQTIGSPNSSDYDKGGNQSSNVDSGRGSAANSSGRKATQLDSECFDSAPANDDKADDSEWVDIVDAELRYILEPGIQNLSIRPDSSVSGSVSSISPPLPPLSPDNSSFHMPSNSKHAKDSSKQEYGTDSYNRPGRGPIGPSRAGWPGSAALHKHGYSHGKASSKFSAKKHEQAALKRHLFGLDNDLTSTTTRSLDLESLLGGAWGTAQSISDSETDTQGLRHIRSQLEGLENMYGEVLKMLGNRSQMRIPDSLKNRGMMSGIRRRHGSLSSLPSSSISGRPIRDRRRNDDRRKVKDVKGINKRFQRLESHVVTLARSVAHLSSEMRSQHLVTQELEKLRDEFAAISRGRAPNLYRGPTIANSTIEPEPTNLTNPRRVKKLTKFFGEDPPLMRLFLKHLGYEKYANLFEAEHVGMIELPYLGEERLQKMGVPLGPRLRILQEAQISLCKDTTLCIV